MKKRLACSIALLTFGGSAAIAADLPVVGYNWTGFYVGRNLG
jgi:hypothetical protein